MHQRIQIAGIIDQNEAEMLVASGVHDLGFPLGFGIKKQDLTEEEASAIIQTLPSQSSAVLITYLNTAERVREFCKRVGVSKVQLHGEIELAEIKRLKSLAPEIYLMKSLVVRNDNLQQLETMVAELAPVIDAFITDTYDPATGQRGATGKTHDWSISRELVCMSPKPVMLAGGLHAGNVAQAIREVRPAGVDAHTGVEGENGRKDFTMIKDFVEHARQAFSAVTASYS